MKQFKGKLSLTKNWPGGRKTAVKISTTDDGKVTRSWRKDIVPLKKESIKPVEE